jgi:predicted transcriptional regulator
MFNWFSKKRDVEDLKHDTKKGFESVKKDIDAIGGWINYLESEKKGHRKDLDLLKYELSSIKDEITEIRNVLSFIGDMKINRVSKTPTPVSKKQTAVFSVQTPVQTAVQTPKLEQFSVTERAILWVLLNADMKLSYDDLAAMLGKERSTIRGQINAIKQKSEGLIEETIEKNGKKRVFVPEEIKEKMLKKAKVRVGERKKAGKSRKNEE